MRREPGISDNGREPVRSSPRSDTSASTVCLLCGASSRRWLGGDAREIRRCASCRFLWIPQGIKRTLTGRSMYEDDEALFVGVGAADYYLDSTARDAADAKLKWVERYVSGPAALLDVGANVGYYCSAAARRFDARGLEPNLHAVRWGREHLNAPLERGSVYDDRPDFEGRFDVITLFDVIEHLEDPDAALLQCRRWLNRSGRLFISTPDAGSVVARLLRSQWYYIDWNEHVSLFTRDNLSSLLNRMGFRTVSRRSIGRRYRFSYIERKLAYLAKTNAVMRVAHVAAQPLRFVPRASIHLNLGDVMGVVAERTD
jgi:SAM-dependent methyltransferase